MHTAETTTEPGMVAHPWIAARVTELIDTAYHEAGHAVACFLIGSGIQQVSIVPDDESFGRVRHAPAFRREDIDDWGITPRDRSRLEARIVAAFAGPVAEAKGKGRELVLGQPTSAGGMHMIGALGHLGRGLFDMHPDEQAAYLEWLLVRARLLVADGWFLIEPLAAELLRERSLSGPRTIRLLRASVLAHAQSVMPEAFASSTAVMNGVPIQLPPRSIRQC